MAASQRLPCRGYYYCCVSLSFGSVGIVLRNQRRMCSEYDSHPRIISGIQERARWRHSEWLCHRSMYHATCKVAFQPFNRSYSQIDVLPFLTKTVWAIQNSWRSDLWAMLEISTALKNIFSKKSSYVIVHAVFSFEWSCSINPAIFVFQLVFCDDGAKVSSRKAPIYPWNQLEWWSQRENCSSLTSPPIAEHGGKRQTESYRIVALLYEQS